MTRQPLPVSATFRVRHGLRNTGLRLARFPAGAGSSFREIARRAGDFALVGAGSIVQVEPGSQTITLARLAFIGVASTAVRALEAEAQLVGQRATADVIEAAAAAAVGSIEPSSDIHATAAYRRHVARVLAEQVLQEAIADAS